MEISGKVALITGGSSGIGFALAQELLKQNIKGITIVDLNPPKEELSKHKVIFVKTDVFDKDALEEAFKKTIETFNNLDIVFNNAGILENYNWKKLYDVNLTGTTNCLVLAMQSYLPKYKSGEEALIVNSSSISGLNAFYCYPHYSASKFGVLGLVLAYGNDYYFKQSGVKIMAICPGVTDTKIFDDLGKKVAVMKCKEELFNRFIPQDAEDVARNTLEIIKEGVINGSVWTIVQGKRNKINYPVFVETPE